MLLFSAGFQTPPAEADLILTHGKFWTGIEAQPWADAVAIRSDRILGTGSAAEIALLGGKSTQIIDLGGRLATPGFNDAHMHFLTGSLGLAEVDLIGATSLAEVQRRVREFALSHPDGSWITGAGWEYSIFPGKRLPTRADLDWVVRNRPVFLRAYDGHTGWANSKALELARITANSKFSSKGEVVVDPATKEPTGVLKEAAQGLLQSSIPAPSKARKLVALREGLGLIASLGITSIQNAGGNRAELELYEELARARQLTARVSLGITIDGKTTASDIARISDLKNRSSGSLLRIGAVKLFLDGVIEAHTAALLDPYSDSADTAGEPFLTQATLDRLVSECDRAGLQVSIHAIGDRAVRMALDAFQHARLVNGAHDARFRIEHIETIAASDIGRFARLGVIASMEPVHADPGTNEVWSPALGAARAGRGFAWHSLERAGARLAFSSDWPATISLDPIRGIHCAVNRRTIDGRPPGGWLPEERVSLDSALRAYTSGGAYASFEEGLKGTLAPGMLADIVVLDQDLFRIDPMAIYKTGVVMTILGGKIVFGPKSGIL